MGAVLHSVRSCLRLGLRLGARALHRCAPAYHVSQVLACALLACGGGPEAHTAVSDPIPPAAVPPDAAVRAEESVLSEAAARVLLSQQFRAAGFRIVYDVRLTRPETAQGALDVTVDGFDPAAQVGFEYIAESERDEDLEQAERLALEGDKSMRVLIVDALAPAEIERRAESFLRALKPPARKP